jgi:hypothetical protein
MKTFTITLIKCGSLEKKTTWTLEAQTIEEARKIGTERYNKPNHFIGAQAQ